MKRSRAADFFSVESDEEEVEVSEDEEESKIKSVAKDESEDDDDDEEVEDEEEEEEDEGEVKHKDSGEESEGQPKKKLKLSKEEVEEKMEKIKKSGVVYISRIPPFMKPDKMKHILSRFGEVTRIFLAPEDPKARQKRAKYGGNKKKKYTEGWAEFARKRDAKLAAETLNGNPIGGKKNSFFYDDILNVKYLHKFKWKDLTEQVAMESQARHEKLRAEIRQATRENRAFMDNLEQSKVIKGIQAKRAAKNPAHKVEQEVRREFDQRAVTTRRATAQSKPDEKVSNVLRKVF
ncbi:pre-rRNA-processing protein Esf2p [Trichomonascus vanleenenianus]|uniref:RNA-binding ATPase activator ESF2 n=1 Tax=Trichomonascus vanleenenianus TaxID=2268995 RepID=UPI003ECBA574